MRQPTTPSAWPCSPDREWTALTRALDRPEWLEDARFRSPELRQRHINERLALTQDVLLTRPAQEWLDRLTREGLPCAPVLTRTAMIQHPQVLENGIVVETEHPAAGRLRAAPGAARFSATPETELRPAPGLGEHTHEVLSGLGYTADEIAALRAAGALGGTAGAAS